MIIQGTAITGTTVSSSAATVAADSYFNLVSLLLPGNGTNGAQNNTFLDSSSNALTVTRSGNPTQGTFSPFSQTGWSNYFDGSGDNLSVADNAALDGFTGDFTIEFWVYFNSVSGNQVILDKGWNTTSSFSPYLFLLTGGNLLLYASTGGSWDIASGTGLITSAAVNTWYHIAVSRSGSIIGLYRNGTQVTTIASSSTFMNSATALAIGSNYAATAGYYLNGYVSNLRIVKGSAVYTSAFTSPTTALTAVTNTTLLTCQSNRFIDNSTNAFAITANGNTAVQAFAPFNPTAAYSTTTVGGSAYLDGSGDYLTISNPASLLTFGTGDFTIECFVYPTAASSSSYVCWIYGNTSVINAIIINSNTGAVTFRLRGTNLSETDVTSSSGLLRVGEWTHLALVRTGTNFYGYVNGTRFSTTIASNAAFNEAQAQFFTQPQIGAKSNTVGDYFTGYVSGWRALKGTALYTAATITVPSAPLTAIANTSALLNSTNGGITDATAKNVLETVGGAAISTTQSKFGGSSMAFDGNGDYLLLPNPQTQNFVYGTGNFTIEFWFYMSALAGSGNFYVLYDGRPSATTGAYVNLAINNATPESYVNGATVITGSALSANTWYHFAYARSGSSTKMFINGTQVGSTYTDNTNYINAANRPVIGTNGFSIGSSNFNGYINDLRITRGYARYTANFTPPTTAFPTQ